MAKQYHGGSVSLEKTVQEQSYFSRIRTGVLTGLMTLVLTVPQASYADGVPQADNIPQAMFMLEGSTYNKKVSPAHLRTLILTYVEGTAPRIVPGSAQSIVPGQAPRIVPGSAPRIVPGEAPRIVPYGWKPKK